jgi:hypothetical protein
MDEPQSEQAVAPVELIEPPRRRRRTHCPHGHELTEANIYRRPSRPTEIECRVCKSERARRHPYKHKPRGGPNGRPPHRPTPEVRRIVKNLVGMGLTHAQICSAIGLGSTTTLEKHYADDLAKGQIAVHAAIGLTYVHRCLGGVPGSVDNPPDWRKADVPALIHYVKSRMGWTETSEVVFRFGQGHDFDRI